MSKTYLGYYGMLNLGDDLMLKTILDSNVNEEINVIQFKDNPITGKEQGVNYYTWPKRRLEKIKFALNFISKSKELIWGGGTCFTDEDGDGFFKYMILGKLLGKKIKYKAIGVGNLNRFSRRMKTKILLNIADEITVRDEKSLYRTLKLIKNKGKVKKEEDLAIKSVKNYISNNIVINNKEEPFLAVGWRNLTRYNCNKWNDSDFVIERILNTCKEQKIKKIVIFDVDSYFDKDTNNVIFNKLKQNKLDISYDKTTNMNEKIEIICKSKFVFTSRLHVAVIAEEAGINCLALNYSPKIRYYAEEVNSKYIEVVECN